MSPVGVTTAPASGLPAASVTWPAIPAVPRGAVVSAIARSDGDPVESGACAPAAAAAARSWTGSAARVSQETE